MASGGTRRGRLAVLVSMLALVAASLVVAMPGEATAQQQTGYAFALENVATGKCLDHSLGRQKGLKALKCNGGPWQLWRPLAGSQGIIWKNWQTGRCLDDSAAHELRAIKCNRGPNQQWWERYLPKSNTSAFINVATGDCLDHSNRYGRRAINCNDGDYQRWRY